MHFKVVVASTNEGKVKEISKILYSVADFNIEIASLSDYNITEPDEPFDSFLQNAIHKAKYYARITQEITLSEDSGLVIDALNGFPGVRTKELIQECGGIKQAFARIEQLLNNTENRIAYFNSAMALYDPSQDLILTHEEKDLGKITFPPRGEQGFAFDPIFIPDGYDQTFAELGIDIKNKISHRAKALTGLIEKLRH